jgi:glycosyltransferase involved in cell wall biosynthesis
VSLTIAPDSQDGAGKSFRGIFDYLRNQGHNVKLITGKWNVNLNDPDIIQFDLIPKRFLWAPQFIMKAVKYLRNHKFDIIHGNAPKGTFPILLSNKKRFITTIHDLGPFETTFTKIPIERILIDLVARKSSIITTVSDFVKKEIKYFMPHVNKEKIYVHYNGIEDYFIPYPKEAEILKRKLKIDGPVLIYIGRIAFYKGVDDIIEAYNIAKKIIPNLSLVVGGKPDFQMEKKYREWKIEYKDIHFIGFVKEEEVPIYYSMGDLFITYSYASEGFGLTPIEAIACGTPVICSSLNVYKEILQDNALFVPPRNPKELAKKIIDLLKNPDKRKNLIENAQKFIKRYTWNSVGKKIEEIYLKSLEN